MHIKSHIPLASATRYMPSEKYWKLYPLCSVADNCFLFLESCRFRILRNCVRKWNIYVLDCVWNWDISVVIMFGTYTYGSQVTYIFSSQRLELRHTIFKLCLELRHTGFKLCLELRHLCSLENEGKDASNNFRWLLPNGRNGCESYNPWPLRVFRSIA